MLQKRSLALDGTLGNFQNLPIKKVFDESLRGHGWIEGKNLFIDSRYFEGHAERIPALAAELVTLKPDLLIATNTQTAVALKSATASIPIVFVGVADPVRLGLVQSLTRPGGNMTGLCTLRARKFLRQGDTSPAGNSSYRLENCELGQSGQFISQADRSRGVAPNCPGPRCGSPDSRGEHGGGTRHRLRLGRSPARRCNKCFWRCFDP